MKIHSIFTLIFSCANFAINDAQFQQHQLQQHQQQELLYNPQYYPQSISLPMQARLHPQQELTSSHAPKQVNQQQIQQRQWPMTRIGTTEETSINQAGRPPVTLERFSTNLFQTVAPNYAHTNMIYSPISVQSLLALLYVGAEGYTATELQHSLQVPANKSQVSLLFQQLLKSQTQSDTSRLIMANKIYYSPWLSVTDDVKNYAFKYFDAEMEAADFTTPRHTAQQIDAWVSQKTQNRIKNLISPSALHAEIPAILINAIYFKARWQLEFSTTDTKQQNFHLNRRRSMPVDMMYADEYFNYGEFPDLQAKVIELPYRDSQLSMLIVLPNEIDGLPEVERRLQGIDLSTLADRLTGQTITLRLPKFQIDFELDLLQPLKMLGITQLFSDNSQLSGFFHGNQPMGISKVLQKAHISVNEGGSEAAAATFGKFIPLTLPPPPTYFTVDHPFMFAIRSPQAVYFLGHVVNL